MLPNLVERVACRHGASFDRQHARRSVFEAAECIYQDAVQVGGEVVLFLQTTGPSAFPSQELAAAMNLIDEFNMPSIMLLVLNQWLAYHLDQHGRSGHPTAAPSERYQRAMRRLYDALFTPDRHETFLTEVNAPLFAQGDNEEADDTDDRQLFGVKRERLEDDAAWQWNPFASNTALVELFEDLACRPEQNGDLIGVLELLSETFRLGPPRTRGSVSPKAGALLVKLYLDRASAFDEHASTIGFTLATYLYNNTPAKKMLLDEQFLSRLDDKVPAFSTSLMATTGLILQSWIHACPAAQQALYNSPIFFKIIALLAQLARLFFITEKDEPAAYRICCVLSELDLYKYAEADLIKSSIWPQLCEILTMSQKYDRLVLRCALVLFDLRSSGTGDALVLTRAAQASCKTMCALSKVPRHRKLFHDLLPTSIHIHPAAFPSGIPFDASLIEDM